MEFNGSSPIASRKEDFLISKDPWFRPVDIKIGPDGAMYIADFYNRVIGHYEVPLDHPGRDRVSGRIWKITYKGHSRKITDWSKASLPELIIGMSNEVLAIRMTATDELVERLQEQAVPSLKKLVRNKSANSKHVVQGIWALYRLNALTPDILVDAISHSDFLLNVHAFKVLANHDNITEEQRILAIKGLNIKNPHVQRAATEVLGRHPDQKNIQELIALYTQVPDYDTHLRYTLLLGIQNHLKNDDIMRHIASFKWNENEAATIAMVASDLKSKASVIFSFNIFKTMKSYI
jgi:HEAT repeat protein